MSYKIKLNPELNLSVTDIALTWNSDPTCRELAELKPTEANATHFSPFGDPDLWQQLGMLVLTFTGGIVTSAMTDLVKDKIKEIVIATWQKKQAPTSPSQLPPPPPEVKVQTIRQADGAVLFIVE